MIIMIFYSFIDYYNSMTIFITIHIIFNFPYLDLLLLNFSFLIFLSWTLLIKINNEKEEN